MSFVFLTSALRSHKLSPISPVACRNILIAADKVRVRPGCKFTFSVLLKLLEVNVENYDYIQVR
jgi:hypothetical protein